MHCLLLWLNACWSCLPSRNHNLFLTYSKDCSGKSHIVCSCLDCFEPLHSFLDDSNPVTSWHSPALYPRLSLDFSEPPLSRPTQSEPLPFGPDCSVPWADSTHMWPDANAVGGYYDSGPGITNICLRKCTYAYFGAITYVVCKYMFFGKHKGHLRTTYAKK